MIKLPSYLTGFASKSDGSASIRFATQELQADDFKLLKENLNEFGWLVFRPNEFKEEDIPKEDAVEEFQKSPSRRLYDVLFVYWNQQGQKGRWVDFYEKNLEVFINVVKTKLT